MTSQGRDFQGHIQAGGQESGAPWSEATLTMVGDEVVVTVNQTEVARLTGPTITDTGQNDLYLIEGADQPLFFRPRDPVAFRAAVAPPLTTAEKIAAAAAQPQDATMVMDGLGGPEPDAGSGIGGGDGRPPSRPWWLIVVALGLVVFVLIAFCGDGEEGATSTTTLIGTSTSAPGTTTATTTGTTGPATTTTTPATTTTAVATTTTALPTTTLPEPAFGAGTLVVGEDVEPGVYETGIVEGLFGCYWERLSGLSGDFEEILANGNVANHDVVEIMDGDVGFSTDCDAWYPLTQLDPPLTAIPEGKWVLGTHITPGTYETPGGDSCYWERLSGLSGDLDDVIANDLPSGQALVEIADDDVAFNSTGCGDWLPRQ
jgi:hypothetical protein